MYQYQTKGHTVEAVLASEVLDKIVTNREVELPIWLREMIIQKKIRSNKKKLFFCSASEGMAEEIFLVNWLVKDVSIYQKDGFSSYSPDSFHRSFEKYDNTKESMTINLSRLPKTEEEVFRYIDQIYRNLDEIVRGSLKGIYRIHIEKGNSHLDSWKEVLIEFIKTSFDRPKS